MKWFYQNIDEYCLGNVIDIEWITEPHRIKYPTGLSGLVGEVKVTCIYNHKIYRRTLLLQCDKYGISAK